MSTTVNETFVPRMLLQIQEQITRMDQRLSRQIAELTGGESTLRVEIFNQLGRFEEHFDRRLNLADQSFAALATRLDARIDRLDERLNQIDEKLDRLAAAKL